MEGLKISLYLCLNISLFVISISQSRKTFLVITCTFFSKKYTELCSALPTHFDCIFLTSQTNSEDVFSEDEWLGFLFLGVKEVG